MFCVTMITIISMTMIRFTFDCITKQRPSYSLPLCYRQYIVDFSSNTYPNNWSINHVARYRAREHASLPTHPSGQEIRSLVRLVSLNHQLVECAVLPATTP